MPRSSPRRRQLGNDSEEAKEVLKRAAERCLERYGIEKTTMEDIAKEAGVSRPSVYRYFEDRDDLFLAVMSDRAEALVERAHRFIARQPTFDDALIEGLIYLADHGRRDPFARQLLGSREADYGQHLLQSRSADSQITRQFWEPLLQDAAAKGALPPTVDLETTYLWLAKVGMILLSLLTEETTDNIRAMLRCYVLPAFVPTNGKAGGRVRERAVQPRA